MRDLFHAFFITKKKNTYVITQVSCRAEFNLSEKVTSRAYIFIISKIILSILYSLKLVNIRFVSFLSFFKFFSKKLLSKKVKHVIIYLRSKKVKKIKLKYIP